MSDLSNVKSGDKVFLQTSGWGRLIVIRTIDKVWKAHFTLVGSGAKYRVSSGYKAGESYSREYVTPYDEKEWRDYLAEKALAKMRYDLDDFKWRECSPELVAKVHALTHPSDAVSGETGTLGKVDAKSESLPQESSETKG